MAGKVVLGIVLFLAGLWLLIPGISLYGYNSGVWFQDFLTLLKGSIPIFLVFIGFILVWIEIEEMKTSKPSKKK